MRRYTDLTEQEKMVAIFKHAHQMAELTESRILSLCADDREQTEAFNSASEFYEEMVRDIENRLARLGSERYLEPRARFSP